jgi:hypothetical protein
MLPIYTVAVYDNIHLPKVQKQIQIDIKYRSGGAPVPFIVSNIRSLAVNYILVARLNCGLGFFWESGAGAPNLPLTSL